MSVWRSIHHLGLIPADTGPEAGAHPHELGIHSWIQISYFFQPSLSSLHCSEMSQKENFSCKLGENTEQMATNLAEKSKMQQAVNIGANINIKNKKH